MTIMIKNKLIMVATTVSAGGIDFMKTIFLLLFLSIALSSCGRGSCSNMITGEAVSPDNKYTATIFERNCGATTPFVQVVSLRLTKSKFNPESYSDWVFTIHGQTAVKVDWKDTSKLIISYAGTGDQPTKRESWQEISIFYK